MHMDASTSSSQRAFLRRSGLLTGPKPSDLLTNDRSYDSMLHNSSPSRKALSEYNAGVEGSSVLWSAPGLAAGASAGGRTYSDAGGGWW